MRRNFPVTKVGKPFIKGKYLVTKTDLHGVITYGNDAFFDMSGYRREELVGKSHNLVRHPDMPPQAFDDLWRTVKQGLPWRGLVKNRCKNGDYYWVDAFVVPIHRDEGVTGYMSVRSEPTRTQIEAAAVLYQRLNQTQEKFKPRERGGMALLSLKSRLTFIMLFMAVLVFGGAIVGTRGLATTMRFLESVYHQSLESSDLVGNMLLQLSESHGDVLMALQHNPSSPYAGGRDASLTPRLDRLATRENTLKTLWRRYQALPRTPREQQLAGRYQVAWRNYITHGVAPARAALRAGDFGRANQLLLNQINPLYRDARSRAQALQQQMRVAARANYLAARQRYRLVRGLETGGAAVGLFIAALLSILLARSIVRPLRQAVSHFERIAQGDLTTEIDIAGRDEPGRLLTSLAAMQVHLKVMLEEIAEDSAAIEQRTAHLQSQVSQVVDQSAQQHLGIQQVAEAMERVSRSVRQVAESAIQAAADAAHAQDLAGTGSRGMEQGMETTARVVDVVQASSGTISVLNQTIQKIGDMTQVIKEIADQTNLLALNAAIEAARAGESGRGFAVVADEVRHLAERTTVSTVDIVQMVSDIQEAAASAVASMDRAVAEVEQGLRLMQTSSTSIQQITVAGEGVSQQARHIADAARLQALATEEASVSIEQISGSVGHNAAAAQQAGQATRELSATAEDLRSLVGHFRLIA